jgi:hypothetical protein
MTFDVLQTGYGNRTYNWEQKITFAMKPAELGNFLEEKIFSKGFDLYHDPEMGTAVSHETKLTLPSMACPHTCFMVHLL